MPKRDSSSKSTSKPVDKKISRLAIEEMFECPCCFYNHRALKNNPPFSYPFTINSAIDRGAKAAYDKHRGKDVHPSIAKFGITAVPFLHKHMSKWQDNISGLKCAIDGTEYTLTGAIDDIWYDKDTNQLFIVDTKATAKQGEVTLDAGWQIGYKRQAAIYQYILAEMIKHNPEEFPAGCTVSDIAYFVYFNGEVDNIDILSDPMPFALKVISYDRSQDPQLHNLNWVQNAAKLAVNILESKTPKFFNEDCGRCNWCIAAAKSHGVMLPSQKYDVRIDPSKESGISIMDVKQPQRQTTQQFLGPEESAVMRFTAPTKRSVPSTSTPQADAPTQPALKRPRLG